METLWNDFENLIDVYITRKNKLLSDNVPSRLMEEINKKIENYFLQEKRINDVFLLLQKKYEVKKSFLRNILSPYAHIFNLNDDEILLRMEYYTNLFGSKEILFQMIKKDSLYHNMMYAFKKGLFDWNDMYCAKTQLDFIASYFNISNRSAIFFSIDYIYYFNSPQDFIQKKVKEYAEILDTKVDVIKQMCLRYPTAFYTRVERLNEKIEGFSKCLNINQNGMKNILVKYPPLLELQITQFKNLIRVLKKFSNNHIEVMTLYPYIIECIDYTNSKLYGDFTKTSDIEEIFEYIFENIGHIEDIIIYQFNSNYYSFCVVKTFNDKYKLLNIGMRFESLNSNRLDSLTYYTFNGWIIFSFELSSYRKQYIYDRIEEILISSNVLIKA